LIDDSFHAGRSGCDVLRGEVSRVIGHLAGKSNDAVLRGDVHRSGL